MQFDNESRLATCGLYYALWIFVLPHFRKYRIRQDLILLENESAKVHRLVKVPLTELGIWDAEHDPLGNKISRVIGSDSPIEGQYSEDLEEKRGN